MLKWLRFVPTSETFIVRDYKPLKRKYHGRSVSINDTPQIKEVERVKYEDDDIFLPGDQTLFSATSLSKDIFNVLFSMENEDSNSDSKDADD